MILDETNTFANAIYIYLVILFTGILVGAILALLNECITSKEDPTSADLEKACISVASSVASESSVTRDSDSPHTSSNYQLRSEHLSRSYLSKLKPKKLAPSNSAKESSGHSEKGSINSNPSRMHLSRQVSEKKDFIKYTMEELYDIQANVMNSPKNDGKVRLSKLLCMQVPIPPASIWPDTGIKGTIYEIRSQIKDSDRATSSIGFFRLACMGSFQEPYSNTSHFQSDFCELMVYLVDSLTIYSSTIMQSPLQSTLVDLAACFTWEHWNMKWCAMTPPAAKDTRPGSKEKRYSGAVLDHSLNNSELVIDSFEQNYTGLATEILQDTRRTVVLPDVTIFRLFCNLYLGSPAIAKSVRAQSVYKLSAIFHACAKKTQCGQHRDMMGLLAQAIASAERDSIKAFFYEIFIDLLQPHVFCCLENDDLFSSESSIYELIFRGLWTDQAPHVREKASKAVLLLGERFVEVKSWIKYMKQTNTGAELSLGHMGAPGSWLEYDCE